MKRVLRQTQKDRIAELEEVLITVMEHCEGKGWRSDHIAALIRKTLRCKYCRDFYTNFRCNCPDECDCPKNLGYCECKPLKSMPSVPGVMP